MTSDLQPGLLVLHGNRAESLAAVVFEWLRRQPLRPLEEEVFLVQSNGMAEWLKMALAAHGGICAATRVELPARFLWRAYRQQLGRDAVPAQSALDESALTWRLMALLPGLVQRPGFEPLAGFLHGGDLMRRLQLARRLADLYDQYQVYRADWLDAWSEGRDLLPRGPGLAVEPLPADQRWQPALWRELLAPLGDAERAATRPRLQQRFLAALDTGAAPAAPLPRRVVLFGMTHVPMQTLQALAALSARAQVVLAVPNPCRYHWADIIDGRELLQMERRRLPLREGRDLAAVALEDMHAHAHPLLAAWGRQGRDFVRQLDAFDDALATQRRFALPRVDLFDDAPGRTLLEQVQARIRDLVPLAEHALGGAAAAIDAGDRSIVFHVAHGAQREVEILHDQLLQLLAQPPGGEPLQPRDIVVMVPDIDAFAPAIRSVFGQLPRSDARFIPFDIADLKDRGHNPLLAALEWLLRLPQQRCGLGEVRDLLDVPAVARRFGLLPEHLPRLAQWMQGAGVRWGLHAEHRVALGLGACGEPNTWIFGLRRMLMGYAVGDAAVPAGAEVFGGIEPYAEVGGLEAALAGSLADVTAALADWLAQAGGEAAPAVWAARGRALLTAFFDASEERERATLAALEVALRDWLAACDAAGFEQAIDLAVLREAWLAAVDAPSLGRRFRAGGVTFCTLLPMRAIPFPVVCLLGMNDGDYPRRGVRSDFDLMGRPGQQRPGDRSRRDDDRQLMLEALLSARRVLYVSWAGRSARDNSGQPPSVLVSQLRDYLAAGWGESVLAPRTTEHPLQPFSRRYFAVAPEADAGTPALFTHAREWRAGHVAVAGIAFGTGVAHPATAVAGESTVANAGSSMTMAMTTGSGAEADTRLSIAALVSFMKNPVKDYFRRRLGVVFGDDAAAIDDDEPFALAGLDEYALVQELLDAVRGTVDADPARAMAAVLAAEVARVQRAGRLPLAEPGRRIASSLVSGLQPMLDRWQALQAAAPQSLPSQALHFESGGLVLDDWLPGLRTAAGGTAADSPATAHLTAEGPPAAQAAAETPPAGDAQARTLPVRDAPSDGSPHRDAAVLPCWLELTPSRLCSNPKKPAVRAERLIDAWVRMLAASACGVPAAGVIVGRDASLTLQPLPRDKARAALAALMAAWRAGLHGVDAPLPLAPRTALAQVQGVADVAIVYEGNEFSRRPGEGEEACQARVFPDFAALAADGRFARLAGELFGPLAEWIDDGVRLEIHAAAEVEALPDEANADD